MQFAVDELLAAFGSEFLIWDAEEVELLHRGEQQQFLVDTSVMDLLSTVAGRSTPEFLLDSDCLLVLALPLPIENDSNLVAVSAFATRHSSNVDDVSKAAHALMTSPADLLDWINQQPLWTSELLIRVSNPVIKQFIAESRANQLASHVEVVSDNLAHTYEEISLLYTLTANLQISNTDGDLGRLALEGLSECVPAKGFAIQFLPVAKAGESTYTARTEPLLICNGDCYLECEKFSKLIEALDLTAARRLHVANYVATADKPIQQPLDHEELGSEWIEQLVVAPLAEGENLFGWIAAFNHRDRKEFGSVEVNLLNSVGTILGIHCGNLELYRQQHESLADFVKAFSSAIDAKDPYTQGHSDRVARISVRLAKEMGYQPEMLKTIYMAGLLHDIGKIGIDDNILRKPGRLTDAEYEHIKTHPELGHKILADIKQLADVLPVVL
ncbi:MAG: HD domain-containing protein, partial [Planctomycetes bacterium]|nr:HD domain-containing protein [Planctomycetota bacterium]